MNQRIVFIVNDAQRFQGAGTTRAMIFEAYELGHDVFVSDVNSFMLSNENQVHLSCLHFKANLSTAEREQLLLLRNDSIIIRTSPGSDIDNAPAHRLALEALRALEHDGFHIVNKPSGLMQASSKLYTSMLEGDWVPKGVVCRSFDEVQEFCHQHSGRVVVKPLLGSKGADVFKVSGPADPNLRSIVETLCKRGYVIAQEYIEEAADGDVRVLMLNGEILSIDGQAVGIRRRPQGNEWRSNIALGGKASLEHLDELTIHLAEKCGAHLLERGICFTGLDIVGDKIIEANVFSPGGLHDLDRFASGRFTREVVRALALQKSKKEV